MSKITVRMLINRMCNCLCKNVRAFFRCISCKTNIEANTDHLLFLDEEHIPDEPISTNYTAFI